MDKQWIGINGEIKIKDGVTIEKFGEYLKTWADDISYLEYEVADDGQQVIGFCIACYAEYDMYWENPDRQGMGGYGEICWCDGGWETVDDALDYVIGAITDGGYELRDYTVDFFDDLD